MKHKLTIVVTEKLGWDHREELIKAMFKAIDLLSGDPTQGMLETDWTKIEWKEEELP